MFIAIQSLVSCIQQIVNIEKNPLNEKSMVILCQIFITLGPIATEPRWSTAVRGIGWCSRTELRSSPTANRAGAGPGANRTSGSDDSATRNRDQDDNNFATAGGDAAKRHTEDGRSDAAGPAGRGDADAATDDAESRARQHPAAPRADFGVDPALDYCQQLGRPGESEYCDCDDTGDRPGGATHEQRAFASAHTVAQLHAAT